MFKMKHRYNSKTSAI